MIMGSAEGVVLVNVTNIFDRRTTMRADKTQHTDSKRSQAAASRAQRDATKFSHRPVAMHERISLLLHEVPPQQRHDNKKNQHAHQR